MPESNEVNPLTFASAVVFVLLAVIVGGWPGALFFVVGLVCFGHSISKV